jgi:hypothetical protein
LSSPGSTGDPVRRALRYSEAAGLLDTPLACMTPYHLSR